MLVTEDEAKEKGCCVPPDGKCGGSRCMAWRWKDIVQDDGTASRFTSRYGKWKDGLSLADRRGYCGLAGEVVAE